MSENDVKYETYDKIHMAEYVNTEYQKWQEIYDIPLECEFNIRLLLQVRWDILHTQPEHTKTKLDLIKIAEDLQKSLTLKKKSQVKEKIMYIDVVCSKEDKLDKLYIYHNHLLTILQTANIDNYTSLIQKMLNDDGVTTIYINTIGIGQTLYDWLDLYDVNVRRLVTNKILS